MTTRTRKMARMENSVDLMTECSAYDRSGVRDYRINLQPATNGPSSFRKESRRGASVVNAQ
jgi:hypothetical protein